MKPFWQRSPKKSKKKKRKPKAAPQGKALQTIPKSKPTPWVLVYVFLGAENVARKISSWVYSLPRSKNSDNLIVDKFCCNAEYLFHILANSRFFKRIQL